MTHAHSKLHEPLPRDVRRLFLITMTLTVLCALGYSFMAYGKETKNASSQQVTVYHAKPVKNDTRVGVRMRAPGTDLQGIPSPRQQSRESEPLNTNTQERRPPIDGLAERRF